MKIQSIEIKDIAGIRDLKINFNENLNIICGKNCTGKTTILECIAGLFTYNSHLLKKNTSANNHGSIAAKFNKCNQILDVSINITESLPNRETFYSSNLQNDNNKLMIFRVNRNEGLNYKNIDSISKDRELNDFFIANDIKNGLQVDECKKWLINRFLHYGRNTLTSTQEQNFDFAKEIFKKLTSDFYFNKINVENEIIISTPTGDIYYEYLSSGFKSCVAIVITIIKEVELRFKSEQLLAKDFEGIVLIDELDMHLHPEWQSKIVSILAEIFPKVQFIVTTHSPYILQHAKENEVISLSSDEDGNIFQENINHGLTGWTLDEISRDVMGLSEEQIQGEELTKLSQEFGNELDSLNLNQANQIYLEMQKIMSPDNSMLEVFRLQLEALKRRVDSK